MSDVKRSTPMQRRSSPWQNRSVTYFCVAVTCLIGLLAVSPARANHILVGRAVAQQPGNAAYSFLAHRLTSRLRSLASGPCGDRSNPQNMVITYYLNIDRSKFDQAYACLDPHDRDVPKPATFKHAYDSTGYRHLVVAALQADGSVRVKLLVLRRDHHSLSVSTYTDSQRITHDGFLAASHLKLVSTVSVPSATPDSPATMLAADNQTILKTFSADVTGDGHPDDVYLTSDAAGQRQVLVYSSKRLFYAQNVTSDISIVQGSDNTTFTTVYADHTEDWQWHTDRYTLTATCGFPQPLTTFQDPAPGYPFITVMSCPKGLDTSINNVPIAQTPFSRIVDPTTLPLTTDGNFRDLNVRITPPPCYEAYEQGFPQQVNNPYNGQRIEIHAVLRPFPGFNCPAVAQSPT